MKPLDFLLEAFPPLLVFEPLPKAIGWLLLNKQPLPTLIWVAVVHFHIITRSWQSSSTGSFWSQDEDNSQIYHVQPKCCPELWGICQLLLHPSTGPLHVISRAKLIFSALQLASHLFSATQPVVWAGNVNSSPPGSPINPPFVTLNTAVPLSAPSLYLCSLSRSLSWTAAH